MGHVKSRWMLVGVVLLLVAGACGGSDADLEGQTWTMTGIGGSPSISTTISTLTFSEGTLTGNTGCNDFSTTYVVDGSSLTIDPEIASTLKACEPAVNDQEAAVFAALTATTKFDISGSDLRLLDDTDTVLARYSSESA